MKRFYISLLCLLLCLTLLTGCTLFPGATLPDGFWEAITDASPSAPSTASTQEPDPSTPYTEYTRLYEPLVEPVPFSELTYERPDAQALCRKLEAVATLVSGDCTLNTVLDAFEEAYSDYTWFATMNQLSYIRYTLDLNDSFYEAENSWCEEQAPLVEQAMEECYIAMGKSPLRDALEGICFTEGFFDYYDEHQIYSNDRVVELMQREAELQNDYMAMQSDMTITWMGRECLVEDLLSDDLDYETLVRVYRAYYEKYAPMAAEYFASLIQTRREIASELDYDSYADFAYEFTYQRDYTPAQVADYTASIAQELSPLYLMAVYSSYSEAMSGAELERKLTSLARSFGGEIATAYGYMTDYALCDFSVSTSKMPGSYMTYLSSYEMPFLYVSPTGDVNDLLTATHEFGHFVDGFVNCNTNTAIDCAEIFSQGLEYLALGRADLTSSQRSSLTASKLSEAILVFLTQACYAEFEQRAYALPDDQLTAEGLNELFLTCCGEFGMADYVDPDILAPGWIDVQHFFIAPFYVISYCVSNDAALQIYQEELRTGEGLELYYTLLHSAPASTILALLDSADLTSPFAPGRMEDLAEFFRDTVF